MKCWGLFTVRCEICRFLLFENVTVILLLLRDKFFPYQIKINFYIYIARKSATASHTFRLKLFPSCRSKC